MALLVLLAVFVVDSVDRRDEVLRWERLGATPTQTRGAAALHAAILTGAITIFSASPPSAAAEILVTPRPDSIRISTELLTTRIDPRGAIRL